MEILDNFGFDPLLFAAQIVNFLIIAYVFRRFLLGPILKTLKDRERSIKKGLSDAEKAAKDLAEAEATRNEVIKKAGKEAEKILADTKKTSEELRDEILTNAKASADKMIAEAKAQANLEMESMEKRAKEASLSVSQRILEKVLGEVFNKNEKEEILKRSVERMKKYE